MYIDCKKYFNNMVHPCTEMYILEPNWTESVEKVTTFGKYWRWDENGKEKEKGVDWGVIGCAEYIT